MSNDSSPPDSNPPKKVPTSGSKPTEGTEIDLWDFDADDASEPAATEPKSVKKKSESTAIPSRRATGSPIQSRKPTERQIDPPASEPVVKKIADEETPPKNKSSATKSKPKETAPAPKPKAEPGDKPANDPEPTKSEDSETKPPAAPPRNEGSGNPWQAFLSSLSKAEKIGISVLVAILALGATLSIIHFSNRVPTRSILSENLDLPVEGKLVKITALGTFWREPVTSGDNPDVVRRGTKLIPVVKLSIESKSAAIRVLFRSEDGTVVGDPINRTINGKSELLIPATAGFDDIGMHAAYRTGESPPWIIQILEAKGSDVSIDQFHEILETEISTDIR